MLQIVCMWEKVNILQYTLFNLQKTTLQRFSVNMLIVFINEVYMYVLIGIENRWWAFPHLPQYFQLN